MNQPKISVIVPVYKVEPYLRKCLDSIVNQTYPNLEIILVDDGSPDNCPAICDEYAAKDARIIVIHQTNAGVSAARNAGLDAATGDYIGFVDSDDWIEPDMYEYLLTNALSGNADITVCGYILELSHTSRVSARPCREILDRESALKALLENNSLYNHVWDKLWKKELFQTVRFPVGRTFEDLAIAFLLFEQADRTLCLPEAKYHYLQRPDSILGDISLKSRMNCYFAARQRYEDMYKRYPQFRALLESSCVAESIRIWACYWHNPRTERERYRTQLEEIANFAKPRWKQAFRDAGIGLLGRSILPFLPYTTWWSFGFAWLVSRVYKLRHGKLL